MPEIEDVLEVLMVILLALQCVAAIGVLFAVLKFII